MKKSHAEQAQIAREYITRPLRCFIVGAGRHCYFCYNWSWLGEYGTFDWYPEFDKKLGEPKGGATREGWMSRRRPRRLIGSEPHVSTEAIKVAMFSLSIA